MNIVAALSNDLHDATISSAATANGADAGLCSAFGNASVFAGYVRIKNLQNSHGIRCDSA
jgi:hypothetical protein